MIKGEVKLKTRRKQNEQPEQREDKGAEQVDYNHECGLKIETEQLLKEK